MNSRAINQIKFEGSLAAKGFDKMLSEQLEQFSDIEFQDLNYLIFDLSEVNFINCYSCQMLIGYISYFEKHGVNITIELPKEFKIRQLMRVWGMDYAFRTIFNAGFHSFSTQNSMDEYFEKEKEKSEKSLWQYEFHYPPGIPIEKGSHARVGLNTVSEPEGSVPRRKNFFAFHTIEIEGIKNQHEFAEKEKENWFRNEIQSAYREKKKTHINYYAPRVVYEAVFNALRHPNASILQIATFVRRGTKELITHFWDNGAGIFHTSRSSLLDGLEMRTAAKTEFLSAFRITYQEVDGKLESEVIELDSLHSDIELSKLVNDERAVLIPFFPNVSAYPNKPGHAVAVAEETEKADKRFKVRGMGLYLLMQTTTQVLGGTLRVRSGNYYLEITKTSKSSIKNCRAGDNDCYSVLINKYTGKLPEFPGTLVSVWL